MMRELSRDMDRNASSFRILNDSFASSIVGSGVKYRPTTSDQEWNKKAARVVDDFMRKDRGGLDSRGIRSGYKIQFDLVRAFAVDGETGFIKLDDATVQCFEAEQLTNGGKLVDKDVDGVKMEKSGKVTGFHIVPYDTMGRIDIGGGDDFDSDTVEWAANRSRFSQTRGVPMLVASLDDWERLDSFLESEIIAAEQGSQIYGVLSHPEGDMGTSRPFTPQNSSVDPSETIRGGLNANSQVDWQPTTAGALMDCPDGKTYTPVDPKRPNPNAVTFLMEILRQFCANTGQPYEFVYNDVRGLSWSVNRALVQLARDRNKIWQTQGFGSMFTNLYQWLVALFIQEGRLEPNDEWDKMDLAWEQISWPDEGAEYEAQQLGLLKGITTRHRVHGPHWRDVMEERFAELEFASELTIKHNIAFPDFKLHPYFFLGFEDEIKIAEVEKADLKVDDAVDPGSLKSGVKQAEKGITTSLPSPNVPKSKLEQKMEAKNLRRTNGRR
jgi:capsid protein